MITKDGDTITISKDPNATPDALAISITRTQEVEVWQGSLQGLKKEIADAIDAIATMQKALEDKQELLKQLEIEVQK